MNNIISKIILIIIESARMAKIKPMFDNTRILPAEMADFFQVLCDKSGVKGEVHYEPRYDDFEIGQFLGERIFALAFPVEEQVAKDEFDKKLKEMLSCIEEPRSEMRAHLPAHTLNNYNTIISGGGEGLKHMEYMGGMALNKCFSHVARSANTSAKIWRGSHKGYKNAVGCR